MEPYWLGWARRQLAEFPLLPEDWDNLGGLPPTPEAAQALARILEGPEWAGVRAPLLAPTVIGSILASWSSPDCLFTLEALRNGRVEVRVAVTDPGWQWSGLWSEIGQQRDVGELLDHFRPPT
jgi:hypothetical protein